MRVGDIDYISLTDLARYKNPLTPGDVIIKWKSNKRSEEMISITLIISSFSREQVYYYSSVFVSS